MFMSLYYFQSCKFLVVNNILNFVEQFIYVKNLKLWQWLAIFLGL